MKMHKHAQTDTVQQCAFCLALALKVNTQIAANVANVYLTFNVHVFQLLLSSTVLNQMIVSFHYLSSYHKI